MAAGTRHRFAENGLMLGAPSFATVLGEQQTKRRARCLAQIASLLSKIIADRSAAEVLHEAEGDVGLSQADRGINR
nr:hypothetical protein CFP56_12156 [Quercus suber]